MNLSRVAALGFLAFAVALGGAWALPSSQGALPGPAFFPLAIAFAMAGLSIALLVWPATRLRRKLSRTRPSALRASSACCSFYLMLWGTGLFFLRTAFFLALMLRWTGESWKSAAGAAAGLTTVVVVAFQLGLKVTLE
ncbi:MAG: tripartite tricarboxylate transporter TctB family protein [Bryobacterales bacterium]